MREVSLKVYSFNELSEEARERVLRDVNDINLDYEWYQYICDDALVIGLEIESFDIYNRSINGKLMTPFSNSISAVFKNHGLETRTHEIAKFYLKEFEILLDKTENERELDLEEELEELEENYKRSLLREYLNILSKEYDYLISEEAIIETINANNYEFTVDGKIYYWGGKEKLKKDMVV